MSITKPSETAKTNPSTSPAEEAVAIRDRIPMNLPMQKLEVPDIPGYHLHWMRGDASRVQQALRAGYEFVLAEEVSLNNRDLAGDARGSGNTDLGSRVSISAGSDLSDDKQPVRLYLMKIKEELWREDQKILAQRNLSVAQALTGGMLGGGFEGETRDDQSLRYVDMKRTKVPDFFKPKGPTRGQ